MRANVTIAYGLPGSGKSFYALRRRSNYDSIVHMDEYIVDGKYMPIKEVLGEINGKWMNVYIDSLVTTNKKLEDVIVEVYEFYRDVVWRSVEFKVIWWERDREACHRNIERRNDGRNVSVSVDNLPYEEVDESEIKRFLEKLDCNADVSFERRKVYRDSVWDSCFQPMLDMLDESEGKYLYSEPWSLGGSWANSWGDSGSIEADDSPLCFNKFDKFLEEVCPNLSFIQYKKIFNECVDIETESESDYYGGTEYWARYKADLRKCYDMLLEMGVMEV